MRSLALSIQTLPLRPVTRGAVVSTAAAVAATLTLIVIGGKLAPGREDVGAGAGVVVVPVHVQPVPARAGRASARPGAACVTVVVEPSVGAARSGWRPSA